MHPATDIPTGTALVRCPCGATMPAEQWPAHNQTEHT